jgi:hypothetical protein
MDTVIAADADDVIVTVPCSYIAVEYSPMHGSATVVVWLLFLVVDLKALVCLLPVKSGYNDVGISTISFSGFGPNPAGFAQIRVG